MKCWILNIQLLCGRLSWETEHSHQKGNSGQTKVRTIQKSSLVKQTLSGYLWLKSSCITPPHPTWPQHGERLMKATMLELSAELAGRSTLGISLLSVVQLVRVNQIIDFLYCSVGTLETLTGFCRIIHVAICYLSFTPTEAQGSLPSLLEQMFQFWRNCPTRSNGYRGPNAHLYLYWSLYQYSVSF